MSTFVSMTVHCARCHDHKFDPISQKEYYRLQAVFAGVDRGDTPYANPAIAEQAAELQAHRRAATDRYTPLAQRIASISSPALSELDNHVDKLRRQLRGLPSPLSERRSPSNGYHSAIRPTPNAPAWVQLDLGATVAIDEIRLVPARPTDFPDTPGFGFPRSFRVEVSDDPAFRRAHKVAAEVQPDHPGTDDEPYIIRTKGPPARYVRITATRLWKRLDDYVFALAEIEVISSGVNRARGAKVTALDSIEAGLWARRNLVDGFDSRLARPGAHDAAAEARHDLLYRISEAGRQRTRLAESLVDPSIRAERAAVLAEIEKIDARIESLPKEPMVYAALSHAPRPVSVLRRGDVEQPGEPAAPGTLACLPGLAADFVLVHPDDEGSRRAALADWIASPRNMLTWRSIANRVWQYHFGRGIVETPNDFGRNGAQPTHPELLDWLATFLLENGQSLKGLHRLIVCSAVYRQSSLGNSSSEAIDADNRFLWRQNRRRLDAETMRDSVLMVAGTLDGRMGGPGFELFAFKDDHSPVYDHTDPAKADNAEVRRRTVYRFTVRSVPNPFMEALDCADPNLNTPVRSQTLTALQALALWNDVFMVRQSHALARRLEESTSDLSARIVAAYRLTLGREPRDQELADLAAYAARHGLANACRLLWNTNEFVFID